MGWDITVTLGYGVKASGAPTLQWRHRRTRFDSQSYDKDLPDILPYQRMRRAIEKVGRDECVTMHPTADGVWLLLYPCDFMCRSIVSHERYQYHDNKPFHDVVRPLADYEQGPEPKSFAALVERWRADDPTLTRGERAHVKQLERDDRFHYFFDDECAAWWKWDDLDEASRKYRHVARKRAKRKKLTLAEYERMPDILARAVAAVETEWPELGPFADEALIVVCESLSY